MKQKVFLDTNFLLSVFELKKDFLTELEENFGKNNLVTSTTVTEELERKGKPGKMALSLLQQRNIEILNYTGNLKADDAILEICEANSFILATQDKELCVKAKNKALKTIRIRQNTYLIN